MKADIIQIGNSKGLRIPKAVLEQCNLNGRVQIDVQDKKLIISNVDTVRDGWEKAFKEMAATKDDQPILESEFASEWDNTEWHW